MKFLVTVLVIFLIIFNLILFGLPKPEMVTPEKTLIARKSYSGYNYGKYWTKKPFYNPYWRRSYRY